jgi:hypothetical protein
VTDAVKATKNITIDVSPIHPDCTGGHEFVETKPPGLKPLAEQETTGAAKAAPFQNNDMPREPKGIPTFQNAKDSKR